MPGVIQGTGGRRQGMPGVIQKDRSQGMPGVIQKDRRQEAGGTVWSRQKTRTNLPKRLRE